jgi:hypothetical protein
LALTSPRSGGRLRTQATEFLWLFSVFVAKQDYVFAVRKVSSFFVCFFVFVTKQGYVFAVRKVSSFFVFCFIAKQGYVFAVRKVSSFFVCFCSKTRLCVCCS